MSHRISTESLTEFIRESNAIESIHRDVLPRELAAAEWFLSKQEIFVEDMVQVVQAFEPSHHSRLRNIVGIEDVCLDSSDGSSRECPPSGPEIQDRLNTILMNAPHEHPYRTHLQYELLHPFNDGNGRSGRLLWLWQMLRLGWHVEGRSFLHHWYYQSIQREADRTDRQGSNKRS